MKTKQVKAPSAKELTAWDCTKGLHPYHARQAMQEAGQEIRRKNEQGIFDEGDANHPKYNNGYNYATGQYVSLFGYAQDELLAKQY